MAAISYRFCDWVINRIKLNLGGKLPAELVLDEREGGLALKLKKAVNQGVGACVVVGVGDISPQGVNADDTQCEITVNVAIMHNSTLKPDFDSRLLAEELFTKFAGAEFEQPPCLSVNVRVDRLNSQGDDGKLMHTFSVSYLRTLKGV